ncbi:hypothetical protein ACPSL3_07655 [Vibrio owensii]|uniref:hypothetical protein n=1 Tax=Vibrio owensii TaxID=696485 RepID=UPI003CE4D91A
MKLVSNILTVAIFSAFSVGVSAAATEGTLNFNFSGVVPAKTVDASGWDFVIADGVTKYVAPGSISMNAVTQADESVVLTSNSEEFYIAPEGANTFSTTAITAQLVGAPTITGSALLPSEFDTVTSSITINGLEVIAASETTITTPEASDADAKRMVLGAHVNVPADARASEGGNVTLQTTIRFSAEIA